MDSRKLLIRSLSGLVYIGIIIGCIFWGEVPFSWLAAVFAAIAVVEFKKITGKDRQQSLGATILDIAGAVCLAFSWKLYPVLIWIFIYLCRFTMELYSKSDSPLSNLANSMMSQVYIAMPLGIMACIGYLWNLHIVLAIFLMIWINDTGAFIVGSMIGKHRLFERISPKKSWEGFFGGLVFNLIAAYLFCIYGGETFSIVNNQNSNITACLSVWLGIGIMVTVFATWGDLVESMIKRNLKIKDSGNIIPGHGGILDRIDSLLLVMPAAMVYLWIMTFIF